MDSVRESRGSVGLVWLALTRVFEADRHEVVQGESACLVTDNGTLLGSPSQMGQAAFNDRSFIVSGHDDRSTRQVFWRHVGCDFVD
jgi:hypothetical protein